MAPRKRPSPSILSDDQVASLTQTLAASLGPDVMKMADNYDLSLEDKVRFQAVSQRCKEVRTRRGFDIKDVARHLNFPQYGLLEIEDGQVKQIMPGYLSRYLRFLGLARWYAEWSRTNPELARKLAGPLANRTVPRLASPPEPLTEFQGEVVAVKARIRLLRSFDQISHDYKGYTLVIANPDYTTLRLPLGPRLMPSISSASETSYPARAIRCPMPGRSGRIYIR